MLSRRQFLGECGVVAAAPFVGPPAELAASPITRGVYLPGWKAVGSERLARAERMLDRMGLNTLMVDLKDANGDVFFAADNQTGRAHQAKTAEGHRRSLDFSGLRRLRDQGVRLLGRHVMFRDRALFRAEEKLRLRRIGGEYWVDPRLDETLAYNLDLIKQANDFGFDEIVLDYIRFPAVKAHTTLDQKCERIDEVVAEVRQCVTALGVQVFGWAAWHYEKAGVGQRIPTLDPHVDHVYPMIYPSHFQTGSFGFDDPNLHPHFIIRAGYLNGIKKVSNRNKIVPMLQSFWHEPQQVREQLDAVKEVKMPGYVAWNARGNYELLEAALQS